MGCPIPTSEYRFHPYRKWRFDYAFVDKKLARFLAQNNTSIVFSIDSLNEIEYENFTRTKNSFKRVMQNVKDCRKIFAKKIRKENGKTVVNLAINMLILNSNSKV